MAINNKYNLSEKNKVKKAKYIRERMVYHRNKYLEWESLWHSIIEECPKYKYKGFP